MAMPAEPKPASKAYQDQLCERMSELGLQRHQIIEQIVADLMRCGCRPREAWRLAWQFTQEEVAKRFNEHKNDPGMPMRSSRICEYEKWPHKGVRPTVRTLGILAEIYKTTWDRLVDIHDLQVMPAADLQKFHDFIKECNSSSPSFKASAQQQLRRSSDPSGGWRSGNGLPGEVTHFTGREAAMAELRGVTESDRRRKVVTVYAIDGMAGVGKTAFVRHAAQEFAKRYPEGAIWVDLYGHTPGMQPREPSGALEQMLLRLGMPPEAIKADPVERRDQWRHQIHDRRMLIVLDNARTSDQVQPLLPEAPGCLVLITSRRKLTSLTDAYPLSLDVLTEDEAEELFIKLVGEQRCGDRDAVREILAACGRLPLAIRLIAGLLRHHPGELLADIAADFSDQTAALDKLVAEHVSVRAAFEWSYRLLTEEQSRAFRLLGWHPGPEITPLAIAALTNIAPARGRHLLRELVDHNLIEQRSTATGSPGGPRYRMHDLVRLYAQERAAAQEPPTEREAAIKRLARRYLAITQGADRLLRPYAESDPGNDLARESIVAFADTAQARAWLAAERDNLLGCVQAMNPSTEGASLSALLAVHFRDFGFWSHAQQLGQQALTFARHLDDQRLEAEALRGLGEVRRLVGEGTQAREYYTQVLTLARRLGDQRIEAEVLRGLGQVGRMVGEYHQARQYHTEALTLARRLGDQRIEAEVLRGLGQVERLVGEYHQAQQHCRQALALAVQCGDQRVEADSLWGLGQVQRLIGEYHQAQEYHNQALALARRLGYRRAETEALGGLGQVQRLIGEYHQAQEYHNQALALARRLGYRRAEADALAGLGEVKQLMGEYRQARDRYTQALTLSRDLNYRFGEAEALQGLGRIERLVGEYALVFRVGNF
ncbi:MAG TPA: tetratricopeptide repeat protein [Pseudonocardiaceae bacterium]|nr:tetratricopeptide repeat protein [Pseudonocardiaceae bacterium]